MTEMPLMRSLRVATALGLAMVALMLVASEASAARYEVHACRLPDGTPIPASGWEMTGASLSEDVAATIDCPGGGMSTHVTSGTHQRDGSLFGFELSAPPGTTIVGWKRTIDGHMETVNAGPPPWNWDVGQFGDRADGTGRIAINIDCGNCGSFHQDFDFPTIPVPLSRLFVAMQCDPYRTHPCSANGSHFTLRSIAVYLEDERSPQVVTASSSLLDGTAPKRGLHYLSMSLRDVGGGLYRAQLVADGNLLSQHEIDGNQGACKLPFVQPRPCKLDAKVDLPVDLTRLSPGRHELSVRILDATGVNAAVYGPFNVEVEDATRLRCPQAANGGLTRKVHRTLVRFGGATWVTGRATGPAAKLGTRVRVLSGQSVGAALRKGGRFRLKVRPAKSGALTPVLVDRSGAALVCGKPARVRVRAGARLTVSPRLLRNRESIRLSGRVRGAPIPPNGKTIVIQARARGRSVWSTVTVVRSNADGKFAFGYRFRRTFQPTTYEFRALVPRQRGYPYARGWSGTKLATVRP